MKNLKMSYLITILLCMVIIDCSPSAYKDSKIIGKWTGYYKDPNTGQETQLTMEFFKDKTCVYGALSAKWVILEDNRIKIDTTEGSTILGKLENGVLTFSDWMGLGNVIFKKNKNR